MNKLPRHWPFSVAGAVAISSMLGYLTGATWQSLMVSAVVSGIAAFAAIFFIGRHMSHVSARLNDDAPFSWDVWMNGVKIGLMTDAHYAIIQRHALDDGRLMLAQALNLGRVALNVAGKIFVGVPLLMFWVLVVASLASPQPTIAQAWHTLDLVAIRESLRTFVHVIAAVSVVSVGISFVLGYRFGFRNHYSEAVARMIRQHCNTPTEGDISLARIVRASDVIVPR